MNARLSQGGRVDRKHILNFRFNGRTYQGLQGDTLASALLANGVSMVARSWKYDRAAFCRPVWRSPMRWCSCLTASAPCPTPA
jgi:hypothetical protein